MKPSDFCDCLNLPLASTKVENISTWVSTWSFTVPGWWLITLVIPYLQCLFCNWFVAVVAVGTFGFLWFAALILSILVSWSWFKGYLCTRLARWWFLCACIKITRFGFPFYLAVVVIFLLWGSITQPPGRVWLQLLSFCFRGTKRLWLVCISKSHLSGSAQRVPAHLHMGSPDKWLNPCKTKGSNLWPVYFQLR